MQPAPLFRYNWQVREEYFDRFAGLPGAELRKPRTGGYGGILRTLAHIVIVEQGWVRAVLALPYLPMDLDAYPSLGHVKRLSGACRPDVERFVSDWSQRASERVYEGSRDGQPIRLTHAEIAAHLIAHEAHHAGQLSVWAREAGIEPPSADVISRGLYGPPGRGHDSLPR
jgi:uncharacterized damage-inducible protein DinB